MIFMKGEEEKMDTYLLEMKHITKKYGENTVLKDMELHVKPHEIHALLGETEPEKLRY